MVTDRPDETASGRSFWWWARAVTYLVYAYVIAVELILLAAFVLRLFGADGGSAVVDWIYRSAGDAMSPFREVFSGASELYGGSGDSVIESAFLFAAVSYGVLALVLRDLVAWLGEAVDRRT